MIHTRKELLLPLVCPATVGLSGTEREFDLDETNGGARGDPYPGTPCSVFNPKPEPRLDVDAAVCAIFIFMFILEQ